MENGRRLRAGTWVSLLASGALQGVVIEDAGKGNVVVQFVVGEWMLTPAESPLEEDTPKPDE